METRIPRRAYIRMLAQQLHGAQQQVVKIQRRSLTQNVVVHAKYLSSLFARLIASFGGPGSHFVRSEPMILCVADLRAHAARRVIVGGKIELRQRSLYGGGLVIVIVNRKIARQAEVLRFAANQTRAERVKSGNPDFGGVASCGAQQVADALFHHACGLLVKVTARIALPGTPSSIKWATR